MSRVTFLFVSLVVFTCSVASADFISGTPTLTAVPGVTLTSETVNNTTNVVDLSFDVTKMPATGWTMNFTTTGATEPNRVYEFDVTLKNDLLFNKEIGGLDIKQAGAGGYGTSFGDGNNVNTNQSAGPFHYALNPHTNTTSDIYYGGLAGGGGSTPNGQSETFVYDLRLPTNQVGTNNFTMTFTANPEPGSLALAGLLGISGLLGLRRRRSEVTRDAIAV